MNCFMYNWDGGDEMKINMPYGKSHVPIEIPDGRISGVLVTELENYKPGLSQQEIVRNALNDPFGKKLCELARGKRKVVIIASDHTRPVPSKLIIPGMLAEIRRYNPDADITILIATGCHRGPTREELAYKFTPEIMENEKIEIHNCDDTAADIGILPSGGRLLLNKTAIEADLLVAEGFIEPHFFAGYSGGRKSVLPGIAARESVLYNHNAKFIAHPFARTGILEGNPLHTDMLFAAKKAKLAFICNVVINSRKEVVYAVAGDAEEAHKNGCAFLDSLCRVKSMKSDIVITTNGGYPLDQNIYQSVKGMTAAEALVNPGGVIIMLSQSGDGHGGEHFYKTFKEEKDIDAIINKINSTPAEETIPDQWQSQIFARILKKATVIYVSDAPREMVSGLGMLPASDVDEAIKIADELLEGKPGKITVIPDGVGTVVS
jgi:nickel-dependent lactate racemase